MIELGTDTWRVAAASTALLWLGPVATARQDAPDDPAPPRVQELAAVAPPVPADYPELTFHRAPKPLPKDAVTQNWPGFLGPARDAHSLETGLLDEWPAGGPALVWEMERGRGYASPAVQGSHVVFTHRVGGSVRVDCLDAESGKRYWRFSYETRYRPRYISNDGPRSTPAISDGYVYVHGVEGMLHCLELATGRVAWKRDLATEFEIPADFFGVVSSPFIHGDLLIQNLGAPDGPCVAAFDKRTGRLVWGAGDEWGPSCASPVVATVHGRAKAFVLAGGESRPPTGGLLVIDAATGTLDFKYFFRSKTFESVTGASPVLGDDRLFITSSYNTGSVGIALEPDGGFEELWKNRHIGMQFSNPVYQDGFLYAVDGRSDRAGAVICIDPKSGEELSRTDLDWEEEVHHQGEDKTLSFSVGEGSLLHVNEQFLCLGDNGHLLRLELSPEGAVEHERASLFRANESWTPLVLSGGLLFVCQNNRERFGKEPAPARLLCYDLRGGD